MSPSACVEKESFGLSHNQRARGAITPNKYWGESIFLPPEIRRYQKSIKIYRFACKFKKKSLLAPYWEVHPTRTHPLDSPALHSFFSCPSFTPEINLD